MSMNRILFPHRLTDAQWRDIYQARARFDALIRKVQPYDLPSDDLSDKPQPIFRPRPIDTKIDQVKSHNLHLQKKLAEHIQASIPKKRAPSSTSYKGIK